MTRRGAHDRPAPPNWPRRAALALLLVAAGSGLVYLLFSALDRARGPVAVSVSPSPSPSPSPVSVTVTAPMSDDQVRDAFITLAAHARGYDGVVAAGQLPDLARQTCSTVAAGANADAVWRAAGDLEQSHGLPVGAAWDFVDIAVTTYCPEHHALVLRTTAAMGD